MERNVNPLSGESWPPPPTAVDGLQGASVHDLVTISEDGNQLTLGNPQPRLSVVPRRIYIVIGVAITGLIAFLRWSLHHILAGPAVIGTHSIVSGLTTSLIGAALVCFLFAFQAHKLWNNKDVLVLDRVNNTIMRNGALVGKVDQVKRLELLSAQDGTFADNVRIVFSKGSAITVSTGLPTGKTELGHILGEFCRVEVVSADRDGERLRR